METPRRPDSWTSNNARRPRYRPQPDRPHDHPKDNTNNGDIDIETDILQLTGEELEYLPE